MKYRIIGFLPVFNNDPGTIVEPEEHWDVNWLVSTGHLEPCDEEPAPKKSKSEPEVEK
jgi:hypothetical protein